MQRWQVEGAARCDHHPPSRQCRASREPPEPGSWDQVAGTWPHARGLPRATDKRLMAGHACHVPCRAVHTRGSSEMGLRSQQKALPGLPSRPICQEAPPCWSPAEPHHCPRGHHRKRDNLTTHAPPHPTQSSRGWAVPGLEGSPQAAPMHDTWPLSGHGLYSRSPASVPMTHGRYAQTRKEPPNTYWSRGSQHRALVSPGVCR